MNRWGGGGENCGNADIRAARSVRSTGERCGEDSLITWVLGCV